MSEKLDALLKNWEVAEHQKAQSKLRNAIYELYDYALLLVLVGMLWVHVGMSLWLGFGLVACAWFLKIFTYKFFWWSICKKAEKEFK